MTKNFLASIFVLAAFVTVAKADVVAYCNGGGCSNNMAAFDNNITSNNLTFLSASNITFAPGSLVDPTTYVDPSLVEFFDASATFAVNGTELDTQKGSTGATIQITVPATYSAILLSLVDINGTELFFLDAGQNNFANLSATATTVGYTNIGATAPWTIQISPNNQSGNLGITGFDPASGGQANQSETPEVGTIILIGSGLMAMRWMRRLPRRYFRTLQTA